MRIIKKCIFCKQDSTNSKSIEHIIPESLGNDELILDKGIVCDSCNNYFSREVEGPVLNLDGFKRLRFYELIESKKGRIPKSDALICGDVCDIQWQKVNSEYSLKIEMSPETIYKFFKNPPKMFFTKGFDLNDKGYEYEISRFLAKIAIEFYVYTYLKYENLSDDELDLEFDEQLSKLIKFVRYGRKDKKALNYEVHTNGDYKPMTNDINTIGIGFLPEAENLIFNLTINNTSFILT